MGYSNKAKDSVYQNNLKLSADKIIEKLDQVRDEGKKSRRRWIWELMQNAKDIPNKYGHVSIEIELFENKLIFKHNGDPFRIDNLTGLIQQVSSKPSNGSDDETTGKFGTGFISTHLLSDKIFVSGIVQEVGETPKRIDRLLLDRSGETSEELMPAIEMALDIVDEIDDDSKFPPISNYESIRNEDTKDNIFEYLLEKPSSLSAAESGVNDLKNTLPLTLAFIPKIKEVKVINHTKNEVITYKCTTHSKEILNEVNIDIKDERSDSIKRCFYTYAIDKTILALEVDNFQNKKIVAPTEQQPYLFKDFPLVGTESFWFPFIVNGKNFMPTERRDSLYLTGEGKKVLQNRTIFENLILNCDSFMDLLIDEAGLNCTNRHYLLQSSLPKHHIKEDSLDWYSESIQKEYRQIVFTKPLIETSEGYGSLSTIKAPYIHLGDENLNHKFYDLCHSFINPNDLPLKNDLIQLHKQIGEYDEIQSWRTKPLFELNELLDNVQTAGNLKDLILNETEDEKEKAEWLSSLFQFIVDQKKIELLYEYKVIPNQNGIFKKLSELKSEDVSEEIPDPFLDALKHLGKDWRDDLLNRNIKFEIGSHDKLSLLDINEAIDDIFNEERLEYNNRIKVFLKRPDALLHVVNILKIDTPESTKEAFRHKLFFAAKDLFGFSDELLAVPNSSKYKYPAANRLMVALINSEIDKKKDIAALSVSLNKSEIETIKWLSEYLELIDKAPDYKYFLKEGNIVPNRKNVLCAYEDLNNYGTEDQPLDKRLINIANMFKSSGDFWDNLLAEDIILTLPKTIKFDEIGTLITEQVNTIKGKESYEEYRNALLELIDWCSTEPILADRYLLGFRDISNRIFFILTIENSTYSGKLMEILKNPENIEMLTLINESGISKDELNEFLQLFPDGIPNNVMDYAKEYVRKKREFNNLLEVGSNVERLFIETLEKFEVTHEIIHAGGGAYDLRIFNPTSNKSFYIELKSCHYQNSDPISLAVSQVKKAVSELEKETFGIVIIERSQNNEMDTEYIKTNTKYLKNPGQYLGVIASNFDVIEKSANTNDVVDLKMNNAEFKGSLDYDWVLDKIGNSDFDKLIQDINSAIS